MPRRPKAPVLEVEGMAAAEAEAVEAVDKFRDGKGRFVVGHAPLKKRKSMALDFEPALESLQRAFPSERIGEMMLDVYNKAMEVRSPKAAMAVLELALAYQYGKPVARMLSVSSTLEEFRELFSQEGNGDDEMVLEEAEGVIEGEVVR
jgi:hypothetical protein